MWIWNWIVQNKQQWVFDGFGIADISAVGWLVRNSGLKGAAESITIQVPVDSCCLTAPIDRAGSTILSWSATPIVPLLAKYLN
jgi:hypothetical protein